MRLSIVMPCYLGRYQNAAKHREEKLVRAIESVLAQSFEDWELIVVADGCDDTVEIVKPYMYEYLPKIKLFKIPKQKIWSGTVRNTGIFKAEGDYIVYLDNDDRLGIDHLKVINDNINGYDWAYFDYLVYNPKTSEWEVFTTNIDVKGQCGTSSVVHKRSLDVYWNDNSYCHDYVLLQDLKKASSNYAKIPCSQYYVCHLPTYKVGYDM